MVLERVAKKGGIPFLTRTILDELDYNKSGAEKKNKNARFLFREFSKAGTEVVDKLPDGAPLRKSDFLVRLGFRGQDVFIISPTNFQTRTNNDDRIIEVADEYGLIFITKDMAAKIRADSVGVKAVLWSGPNMVQESSGQNAVSPFLLPASPITQIPVSLATRDIPTSGVSVSNGQGQHVTLGQEISRGGEGVIYETSVPNLVCKIYHAHCLTDLRKKKIELMLTRRIVRTGIAWPIDISLNRHGEFVGYLMPKAEGKPIQSSMFVKPILEKNFPEWRRIDLVNLCLTFLQHIRFLHDLNVIVGDINPMNLLITKNSQFVWMVDVDSFQVENYPCPVGTVNFTAPEIQGCKYEKFLRTKNHELFAVATMLFMILHPGKPPYSQQGGGTPGENIRAMDFPYGFKGETSSRNAPQGPWYRIWQNLPFKVKEAFHLTFHQNRRVSVLDWIKIIASYRGMLDRGHSNGDLFPSKLKVIDGVTTSCAKCGQQEEAERSRLDRLLVQGKQFLCTDCVENIRIKKLAEKGRAANDRAMNAGQAGRGNQSAAASSPASKATRPRQSPPASTTSGSQPSISNLLTAINRLFGIF